jgi:hypothetical protein
MFLRVLVLFAAVGYVVGGMFAVGVALNLFIPLGIITALLYVLSLCIGLGLICSYADRHPIDD